MSMIFASGLIGLATPAATPVTGAQGQWKLDESLGTTIIDGTGLQNGTYSGTGVTLGRDPMTASGSASSALFDGIAGYGSIPHNAAYGNLSAYTVSLIVQPSSVPAVSANRCVLSKDQTNGAVPGRLSIEQYNDAGTSKLRAFAGSTTTGPQWLGSTSGVAGLFVDTAYRITITVHPSDGSRLYLDGNQVANASGGRTWDQVTFPFTIGAHLANDGVSPENSFHGFIDEVTVWPYKLDAGEVEALPAAATITAGGGTPSPAATNDSYGPFFPGTTQQLAVLDNDSNLTSRTITIESQPSAGTVSILENTSANARLRYVLPSPISQSVYAFAYSVDGSNSATVSVTVNGTGATAPSFFTSTAAQGAYSGPGGGSDTSTASPDAPDYNPTNPKAATFIPSPWGCKMCRLTGEPGTPILINGTTDTSFTFGSTHGHGANSTRGLDCFNADGSLLLIGVPGTHGGTPLMLLDGSTFLIKRVKGYSAANLSFNQDFGFWHPTIPNRYIDVVGSGNNTVIRYWDPSTNSITNSNVRTISGYNSPNSQGQARYIDNSGTRLTIRANRVSDGAQVYFGYDLSTGLKTQDFQNVQGQGAPDGGPYEGLYISASGQYLIGGLGPWEGISGGQVFDVWNFGNPATFVGERRTAKIKHTHLFFDGTDDWRCGAGATTVSGIHDTGDMVKVRVSDGLIVRLTSVGFFDYTGCSFDQRYIYGTSTHSDEVGKEIVAIRANQSSLNIWRRLGPHRAFVNNIRDQPDPVASRNGDMVIFDTNWQGPDTSTISTRRFPVMIYDLVSQNGWDGG